jgi:hypothetical protein
MSADSSEIAALEWPVLRAWLNGKNPTGLAADLMEVEVASAIREVERLRAIVVDLVRSNTDGIVGFVADRRRLNVALTRAKRLLMVIADVATLGVNPDFAAFVDEAERQGAWVSAWTDEAEPMETHHR